MITGFNHNLRVKKTLFHVQTEDKGIDNPQVETQVFVGGNVVAVRRSTYVKFLKAKNIEDIVMAMMQEQHKTIMKDLVAGKIRSAQNYIESDSEELETLPTVEAVKPSVLVDLSEEETLATHKVDHPQDVESIFEKAKEETADKTLDELILDFLKTD